MIFFSRRFIVLAVLGACAVLAAGWLAGMGTTVMIVWNLALAGAYVADLFFMQRHAKAYRTCEAHLSLGAQNDVAVTVANPGRLPLWVRVKDEPPYEFALSGSRESVLRVPPAATASYHYRVQPVARGGYRFGALNLRISGPLRLAIVQRKEAAEWAVRVYPNLLEIRNFDLLTRRGRLLETGIKPAHIRGGGTEFETLRDYVPGDDYRRINWGATARRGRPIMNEYDSDRSQNVMLAIDAGRLMTACAGELTKLDHAVNAALILGYAAVTNGDCVGLLVFADEIVAYLAPSKGHRQLNKIIEALYGIQPSLVDPDFRKALSFLSASCRKRSLVSLFTDIASEETSHGLVEGMAMLKPVHLPVCISISDPLVTKAMTDPARTVPGVFEKAVACEIVEERRRVHRRLQRAGVAVVDAPPGSLMQASVRKYLAIKSRSQL